MQVTLEVHGGLAAGIKRPPQEVDTKTLDTGTAEQLTQLVQAALSDKASATSRSAVPDAMSYTIRIDDGGTTQTMSQSDNSMNASFADLLDWLITHFSAR